VRAGIGAWAFLARRPALYALATGVAARALAWLGRRRGRVSRLPLAGGWTRFRDLPAPQGRTFRAQWASRGAAHERTRR
jgi:L-lactate dehydrogenase complex protein LldF